MTAGLDTDEFINRICVASEGCMGVVISLTRAAVLAAFDRNSDGKVEMQDFVSAYSAERGCDADQNIFKAKDWHLIVPRNSRLTDSDLAATQLDESSKPTKRRK